MWGRQTARGGQRSAEGKAGGSPRALTAQDDLLKRAEWEQLTAAERAAALAPYQIKTLPALSASGDDALQRAQQYDWVAQLVEPQQPEATSVIRRWFDGSAPDTHLFVGGSSAQGRTSLVAALARKAMASRPIPPAYCYAPDPAALDRVILLTLGRAAAAPFIEALGSALTAIASLWDAAASAPAAPDASANHTTLPSTAASSADAPTLTRSELTRKALGAVASVAPTNAQAYVHALSEAILTLASNDDSLPFSGDDVPVASITPLPDPLPGMATTDQGAPVVAVSLASLSIKDALLRANGGVLILPATDAADSDTWGILLATQRAGGLRVKDGWPLLPIAVRVALVGDEASYAALAGNAPDFSRLFRSEVWFDFAASWTRSSEAAYAALADGVTARYALPQFDPSAVSRLIEEGARRADGLNRSRLTNNLQFAHDLAYEAGRLAAMKSAPSTTGADVATALDQRRSAQGMVARRVRESIFAGESITPTTGAAIGQINGLGIYEGHPYEAAFAVPMRISATVAFSRDESLIDIERVSEQADADHVRGELTMEGYLAHTYGQTRALSIAARIRFEQEHGATGGDSASAAELFALLSALAEAPIRHSVAVTGAIGQYGEMQPIGGVNVKIAGFWEICRQRRAQGEQAEGGYGVIIPAANVRDLMLPTAVAYAIATEGWFHIWPIAHVDDGLYILTGCTAQEIRARVDRRLQQFYELATRPHRVI